MRFTIACPLCSARAIARTSRKLSDTMREITFRCGNDECEHAYIAQLEVVRTIVPSGRFGLHLYIPLSGRSRAAHWQAPQQQCVKTHRPRIKRITPTRQNRL